MTGIKMGKQGLSLLFILILSAHAQSFSLNNKVPVDFYIKCSSLENPSKLSVSLSDPSPKDDCDISYDDDCGRSIGETSLLSDLSKPSDMNSHDRSRRRHRGLFNEPRQTDLVITVPEKYKATFPAGFRNQLNQNNRTTVEIETLAGIDGDTFKLICQKNQFPTK